MDLDGTLLELIDRPDHVRADAQLQALLLDVQTYLAGRMAIVSGRSLAQLDRILGPLAERLALSGSHGSEYRWDGKESRPERPHTLAIATTEMQRFAQVHEDVLLEEKSFGVALHYRMAPELEAEATRLAQELAHAHGLYLQEGKMMVELRPAGHDKGRAIAHMMEHSPLSGAFPVFAGDDVTDEAGFETVVQQHGYGVLVGRQRPSAAHYYLPHPQAVRDWLKESLA